MTVVDVLVVLAAGFVAGGINTIVGSGSLVTFPVLLAVGYPSVVANVSNTVGLVFGGLSGAWGYRAELRGQMRRFLPMSVMTSLGAATGAVLLLVLPTAVFDAVIPLLVLAAVALMAFRPRPKQTRDAPSGFRILLLGAVAYAVGVYGGYFGAAQGVILLALLQLLLPDDLQRLNGLKIALATVANTVAAIGFIIFAEVAWEASIVIAVGSTAGAAVAARYGRRLPSETLRRIVVVGGTLIAIVLAVRLVA